VGIRVLTGVAHECCGQTMVMQRDATELLPAGLLFEATHVCLICSLSLSLSALVPHDRVNELRGRRAPGGRAIPSEATP